MKVRLRKKLNNYYLTKRDIEQNTKNYLREIERINELIDEHSESLKYKEITNKTRLWDENLTRFLMDNLNKIQFNNEYFSDLFNAEMKKLEPEEFLKIDKMLDGSENKEEFYRILLQNTDFKIDFFDRIKSKSGIEIIFTLNPENQIMIENLKNPKEEIDEKFGFSFNWFKKPFIITTKYKLSNGRSGIKNILSYVSFSFDTPIEYDDNVSKYIKIKTNINKKKIKEAKKIERPNYNELINKKYLFSSKKDAFYSFIRENTNSIEIDEYSVTFSVNHPYFYEITIKK